MRLLGWDLIHGHPYRKRILGHRHTQRKDSMKTEREDGQVTVHGVTKSQTRLSDFIFSFLMGLHLSNN